MKIYQWVGGGNGEVAAQHYITIVMKCIYFPISAELGNLVKLLNKETSGDESLMVGKWCNLPSGNKRKKEKNH